MAEYSPIDYRGKGSSECGVRVVTRPQREEYDLFLGCVGYELRSSFAPLVVGSKSKERLAMVSPGTKDASHVHGLSFDVNEEMLVRDGFAIDEIQEDDIRAWVSSIVTSRSPASVALDCSSFSRGRLAQIMLGLCDAAVTHAFDIDFLYAPAEYAPYTDMEEAIESAGPVAREFAGRALSADDPLVVAVGLGYEPQRAIGVVEYLDPVEARGFAPHGSDRRFDQDVDEANRLLWTDPRFRAVDYTVMEPFAAFLSLESFVHRNSGASRVVVVPFGPKIFAVLALVVGLLHPEVCSVWRVSSGSHAIPVDRRAGGDIARFSMSFSPLDDA